MKCKVITGIFEGHYFDASYAFNVERFWDNNSHGRSFPVENCIQITEDEFAKANYKFLK